MKKRDRENITTIIHDIKISYTKTFKEKITPEIEEIINKVAKEVKNGKSYIWINNNGLKKILLK